MLQARRLGGELYVGIHSDEAILENKGPTVMNLKERYGRMPLMVSSRLLTGAICSGLRPLTPAAGQPAQFLTRLT